MSQFKSQNTLKIGDEYSSIFTKKGEEILVSTCDLNIIMNTTWSVGKRGYVIGRYKGKLVPIHRLIMNFPDKLEIDHKNRNRLDNRRDNLRVCTRLTNSRNKNTYKNNQANFKGVSYLSRLNKWRARIYVDGKEIHLGMFSTKEEAIQERVRAEEKYYK